MGDQIEQVDEHMLFESKDSDAFGEVIAPDFT